MVYVITDGSGFVKIGTTHQIRTRIIAIQTGNPRKIELIMTFETESMKQDRKLEKILHMEFRKQRVVLDNGYESEWFEDSILESIIPDTQGFIDHICSEYNFHSDVGFTIKGSQYAIEKRRFDNLKETLANRNLYQASSDNKCSPITESRVEEKSCKKPMFKVGDIVQLKNETQLHCWYGGFSGSIRMPEKTAKVISVNDDCKSCNFWYVLDNKYAYSEEMLELYQGSEITKGA